jgi:hypothetical protein
VKQLELQLLPESVVHVPCDTLVIPVPADERPLRGEAGLVDWRVCGVISRQLADGFVAGKRGEAVLLPAPRPLRASRLLLMGLGPAGNGLEVRSLQRCFCTAAEKLLAMKAELALLAPPEAVDLTLDAELLMRGCVQALSAERGPARLRVGMADAPSLARALQQAAAAVEPEAYARRVELHITQATNESLPAPTADAP